MKKILFILLSLCMPFSMHSNNQKPKKILSEKVITAAKLTAAAGLLFLSSRCVYNACRINENTTSFPHILTCFYHGWVAIKDLMANPVGPDVTTIRPHLPLIAASGAIVALSGMYLKNKIQELLPNSDSSEETVHN